MKVVYFPSCAARLMGLPKDSPETMSLQQVMLALFAKAGIEVVYPSKMNNLCCGLSFHSEGMMKAFAHKSSELQQALWQSSNHGEYPVVFDTSPCALLMKNNLTKALKIYETVGFLAEVILPRLNITKQIDEVVIHRTCSAVKMGLSETFISLAQSCAKKVIVPVDVTCCGFAGDKGFKYPELNDSGLAALKAQIPKGCDRGYSNSLTCEIGLSAHAGIYYRSIAYLINECTE
ncbi:(Fe-S)-binding protein [Cysteiniphilum sp. JM-1]|uniref:(Fe-S)-binding protein n=1 Tax=Cysteiniphilum sp. JM-1 TaxID=2610891 RepID=UPI001245157F|nr:(Fe-S)-binding protein [Cysteiniphilum sp. JM-1]